MSERTGRVVLWLASLAWIGFINAVAFWGHKCVVEWLFGQTGAAWVQAIGAIVAIYSGFALNASTQKAEFERERRARTIANFEKVETAFHRASALVDMTQAIERLASDVADWDGEKVKPKGDEPAQYCWLESAAILAEGLLAALEQVDPLSFGKFEPTAALMVSIPVGKHLHQELLMCKEEIPAHTYKAGYLAKLGRRLERDLNPHNEKLLKTLAEMKLELATMRASFT